MTGSSATSVFARWAVAAICLVAGGLISFPFWQHLSKLGFHLASGNWEIISDNEAVEKRLALKYGADRTGIAVHRVAGSGLLLPVTEEARATTIAQVADVSIAEQPALRFNITPLETTYNQLLSRLEEIEAATPGALPSGTADLIVAARKEYDEEREDRGLDFAPFSATTKPDFDVEGEWTRSALTLEQNGRCTGNVSQLGGTESVPADIRTFPRALEVEIERPWLSTPLVDIAAHLSIPAVRTFFSVERPTDGDLRLIPQTMWILQADALSASVNSDAKAKITSWARDNACCKVTCLGRSFNVEPGTVRWKENTAYGVLTSPEQQLFAIVSKRRGN